ncbi:MAG: GAF domain-containing protein [Myxococcales bacterium]|nr:GAF domain-containing protein [Myxococcales bacterium]
MGHLVEGAAAGEKQWFVSDGQGVVGPVETSLVLRGLYAGKIHEGCSVWKNPWKSWRPLSTMREISVLESPTGRTATDRARDWIDGASDAREVVSFALQAIASETRATVALAHSAVRGRAATVDGSFETRSVVSERALELLGATIPASDAALRLGKLSQMTIDKPRFSEAGRATMTRLQQTWIPVAGTALTPIFSGTRLVAVLELAKSNRPFRRSDRAFMREVARMASRRLAAS